MAPGQKLVLAYTDHRRGKAHEVEVERIGRRWAYLKGNEGRVDIDTLEVDGGGYSSPGCCYGSWREYEETTALHKAWDAFRRAVSNAYRCPDELTLDDITTARTALRMPEAEPVTEGRG